MKCTNADDSESDVTWYFINNAYVPAVTVCELGLNRTFVPDEGSGGLMMQSENGIGMANNVAEIN